MAESAAETVDICRNDAANEPFTRVLAAPTSLHMLSAPGHPTFPEDDRERAP
ncbi:hypothetical protein ACL9RL_13185 [Plantibacter sp. Mn2098]|uniref:hypothetical protein n=1 Tax=Plantibacter sp. Mn2098 TaxID=3395266 RepID=UPI003BCFA06E